MRQFSSRLGLFCARRPAAGAPFHRTPSPPGTASPSAAPSVTSSTSRGSSGALLPWVAVLLCLATTAIGAPQAPTGGSGAGSDPLQVLLLDYHAPIEHDVLLSHLCVEPCTRSRGCPEEIVLQGADYWNDDFVVFRPGYLGRNARFVVDVYKNRGIDLLSISGHHASGFSGDQGRGAFDTQQLAEQLRGLAERDGFFSSPSMVMLQGCWTDVKSGFDGDPIEYVRHIIEDTEVRAGESERLLAAVQQIAGNEEAYRDLFPNACILGYQGTQVPGGLFEIWGQINGVLRGLSASGDGAVPSKFPIREARQSSASMDQMVRDVDKECSPTGWPCNLCRRDEDYYRPLQRALTSFLRRETRRLENGSTRGPGASMALERRLENASLYSNSSWSCSSVAPSTPPIFPEPLDRGPYLEMFLDLLMVDFGQIAGEVRFRIESELIHMLGSVEAAPDVRFRLRTRLESEAGRVWQREIARQTLPRLSTFRQRSYYEFLGEIGCVDCFATAFDPATPRALRENAAAGLHPRLGKELYELALSDPSPRVRRVALSRLDLSFGEEPFARLSRDTDPKVREAAQRYWREQLESSSNLERPGAVEGETVETQRLSGSSQGNGL